jgi:hypothetical protein
MAELKDRDSKFCSLTQRLNDAVTLYIFSRRNLRLPNTSQPRNDNFETKPPPPALHTNPSFCTKRNTYQNIRLCLSRIYLEFWDMVKYKKTPFNDICAQHPLTLLHIEAPSFHSRLTISRQGDQGLICRHVINRMSYAPLCSKQRGGLKTGVLYKLGTQKPGLNPGSISCPGSNYWHLQWLSPWWIVALLGIPGSGSMSSNTGTALISGRFMTMFGT